MRLTQTAGNGKVRPASHQFHPPCACRHILAGLCRAVPIFSLCIALLTWRILAEEKMLLRHLAVYHEYCQEMRYRLPPHVRWSTPEEMQQTLRRAASSSNIPEGLFLPLVSNSRFTQSTSLFQAAYMEQTLTTTSARRYRQDISLLPERLKADQELGLMPLKGEESKCKED